MTPRARAARAARAAWLELALLALILAVAFGLRLWGTNFGLPYVYKPDESFEVYRAVRLGMGGFDFERWAKGGYYFLLFAEYGVYFVLLFVTGAVSGVWDFAMQFVADPSPFWKIGRATTAVLGTATVLLCWHHGRRMAGPWCGLAAAWFLAFSLLHVRSSHFITVDVPVTLLTFWAITMIVEDVTGRRRLNPYLFAVVAAFAVMSKFPAILLFIPYLLGSLWRGGLRRPRGLLTVATIAPAVGAGVIYLVFNPGIILNLDSLIGLVGVTLGIGGAGGAVELGPYAGLERSINLWAFYSTALASSQGLALLGVAAVGIAVTLIRHPRMAVLHLSFMVPLFVALAGSSTTHLYYERYLIPLLPGLCLFAAFAVQAGIDGLRAWRPVPGAVITLLAVVGAGALVIQPGLKVVELDQHFSRPDTRTMAVDWIGQNLPNGSRIVLQGFPEADSALSVPLRNSRANIETMIAGLKPRDPGKALFWQLRLKVHRAPAYDLVTVRHFEPWGTLADYRADGVRYAVLRRDLFVNEGAKTDRLKPEWVETRRAFYRVLRADPRAELVAAFNPTERDARGWWIEVWRLNPRQTGT